MRRLLLAAVVVFGLFQVYRWHCRPLDGSTWNVRVRRDFFLSFPRKDTLTFHNGKLTVASYAARDFSSAGYRGRRLDSGRSTWQAVLTQGRGTYQWQGAVSDDRMEGSVLWLGENGKTKQYTFRGKRSPPSRKRDLPALSTSRLYSLFKG